MTLATTEKNIMESIKKVAGLLRISTEKTDHNGKKVDMQETLKNHKQKMNEYCQAQTWELQTYEEVISGGSAFEERKELQALLNDITKYDAIVVMELPRLSRQGVVSELIKEKVIDNGTLIITLNPVQIYDLKRNAMDALMYTFGGAIAEHERRVVSARVKANKISMAKQGLNSSGSVPLGYKRNPSTKKLEIIEEQAAIVRQIFDWYLAGEGQRNICNKLNDLGIKNKQGNKWIPNSIRALLICETYKGNLVAHNYEKLKGKMIVTEEVRVENNHPAIISPEVWNKAQILRNRKKERSCIEKRSRDFNSKANPSILDGLVFCACCQRKSTLKWYSARNQHYISKCSKFNASGLTCDNGGISIKDVEKIVFEKVISYKAEVESRIKNFKSNDFEQRNKELQEQKALFEKQAAKLKLQFKAIRKQEQQYIMSSIEDTDEAEAIAEDKQINQQQRLSIQAKLEEVTKQIEETPSAEIEIGKLQEKIDIIEQLENREDLLIHNVNALLKEIILKINYKRVLPDDSRKFSKTRRDIFPAEIEIEYVQ